MASSSEKTIGLILLIALLALVFVRVTPALFMPLHIMPKFAHLSIPRFDFGCQLSYIFSIIIPWLLLLLWIFVIIWVYRDAERRGMSGVLWALLVFVGNIIALLIYLIVRNDAAAASTETAETCENCGEIVRSQFSYCPHCGAHLKKTCSKCDKPVASDWKTCPYCGAKLSGNK